MNCRQWRLAQLGIHHKVSVAVTSNLMRHTVRPVLVWQLRSIGIQLAVNTGANEYWLAEFNAGQSAVKLLYADVIAAAEIMKWQMTVAVTRRTTRCRHCRLPQQQLCTFLLNVTVEQISSKNIRIRIITTSQIHTNVVTTVTALNISAIMTDL